MDKITVSIAITTFNHEKFISQCLDSILNQKVNFNYEIVIGEDRSSDNTRSICESYKNKFPEKIRLILNNENIGLRKNNFNVWSNCKGKYIAYIEGDDFWSDFNKLQIQIDFLESNPHIIGSGHQTLLWNGVNNPKNKLFSDIPDLMIIDFKKNIEKWLFATCSFVFRNFFIDEKLIDLRTNFEQNILFWSDRPLMVFLTFYGDFVYHNKNIGNWRQHEQNMTRIGNLTQMNVEGALAYKAIADLYPENKKIIKELILRWYLLASEESMLNKKIKTSIKYNVYAWVNISSLLSFKNYIK